MPANKTQTAKKVARQQLTQKRLATGPDPRALAAQAKVRANQMNWARIGGAQNEANVRARLAAQDAQKARNIFKLQTNMNRVANTAIAPAPVFKFESRPSTRNRRKATFSSIKSNPHRGVGGLGRNMFFR